MKARALPLPPENTTKDVVFLEVGIGTCTRLTDADVTLHMRLVISISNARKTDNDDA